MVELLAKSHYCVFRRATCTLHCSIIRSKHSSVFKYTGEYVYLCNKCLFQLWDLEANKKMADCSGHLSWVHRVQFSCDGSQLLSCSDDQTVRVRLTEHLYEFISVYRNCQYTLFPLPAVVFQPLKRNFQAKI